MRLQRIRRAFPWRTATLLAVLLSAPVLAFAAWFVWEIEPLQSYYLLDYWQCSKAAEKAGSATELRWLMKTAQGRKSLPAIPSDVTTGKAGNLSLRLSSVAIKSGWIGLQKSAPYLVYSGELKDALGTSIYHHRSYSNFIALPLLEGCAFALMIVAFIVFTARAELWQELKGLWREVIAADSFRGDWRDVSPIRHGISRSIAPREWLGKVRSKLADWTRKNFGKPASEKIAIPSALQSQSFPSPANIQPADSRTKLSLEPPSQAEPKYPVQGQSIFPGARRANGVQQEPIAWDESQWID
ncbi:MAG: hypothetical protein P4K86_07555 [Terracidiphilus sp.]|nr:hypothetical protein [Terracidiphilus sp.]MDR3777412.1 hypothetical protein [Terracidiphilus sp.]